MGAITDETLNVEVNLDVFVVSLDEQIPRAAWTYLVKRRAGFACERCPRQENLVAHHRDDNKENNCLRNGECLCRACHNKEHWSDEKHREARLSAIAVGQKLRSESDPGWQARGWMAKTHEERSAAAKLGWQRRKEKAGES